MIHPLDRIAGLALRRGPERLKFFSEGWGDTTLIDPDAILSQDPTPVPITWLSESLDTRGHTVSHGTFTSPAPHLPERSRIGTVVSVAPREATRKVVVLMPAWNEHDPKVRVAIAGLLADRGIKSIILENPYYGSRTPDPGVDQPIRTVADFMIMGGAAVNEARGILTSFNAEGATVGVAGYSMGGNTAAIVTATLDFPIASAPLAASHSPGPVFLDGTLRGGIDWAALGGRSEETRLRATLGSASVLNVEPKPHTAHAVIVRAASDGYIPASATQQLVDHWPGSELRILSGGHGTLVWYRKPQLALAIVDAFARLEESQLLPSGD